MGGKARRFRCRACRRTIGRRGKKFRGCCSAACVADLAERRVADEVAITLHNEGRIRGDFTLEDVRRATRILQQNAVPYSGSFYVGIDPSLSAKQRRARVLGR